MVVQTILSRLSGNHHSRTNRSLVMAISNAFYDELRFQVWMNNPDAGAERFLKVNKSQMTSKSAPARSRFKKRLRETVKKVCSLDRESFETNKVLCSTGSLLLDCVRSAHPDLLRDIPRRNYRSDIGLSIELLERVDLMNSLAAQARPALRPMLIPPRPWVLNESTGSYEGGYYILNANLIRTSPAFRHRTRPSQEFLDAINIVQATPWRVNQSVLSFLEENPELIPEHPGEYPKRDVLDKDTYATLPQEEKKRRGQDWSDRVSAFDSSLSKHQSARRKIEIAKELGHQTFYMPHFADFRGRLYPIPSELNPQADHLGKGLLEFANGKQLGSSGITALRIHFANTMGHDKASLAERELWTIEFLRSDRTTKQVYNLAGDDEPLAAVAAYIELKNATILTTSHIPVAVDGVCNGLQHLSLLGKSQLGAEKTNCTSNPIRQDLYSEVGVVVLGLLRRDAELALSGVASGPDPVSCAKAWLTRFDDPVFRRKVCKRPLMTTPYSVTNSGIAFSLVADRIVDDLVVPDDWTDPAGKLMGVLSSKHYLARYMTDLIVTARAEVVAEAMLIMDYFKEAAGCLADQGRHLSWTTPDGLYIQQGYVKSEDRMVKTFDGLRRNQFIQTDQINKPKSRAGASPNVVHSLDAAMLRMVAVRLDSLGITDLAMIHDSYGCHACDIPTMSTVIRQVAVDIYQGNWLLNSFHKSLDGVPDFQYPPDQGTLDVAKELPLATYFFS